MVFSRAEPVYIQLPFGALSFRQGEQYLALLIIEGLYATFVAFANVIVVFVLVLGRKQLFQNPFYIVVANTLACTSLKAIVECSFVLPYYIIQRDYGLQPPDRVFTETYEFLFFNLSVLADYGTLFFSALIALNRFATVVYSERDFSRISVSVACVITWMLSLAFPLVFYLFKCQYQYSNENVYYNLCEKLPDWAQILLNIAVYCSYAVAVVVLAIYAAIFLKLRSLRRGMSNAALSTLSQAETNLLRQSLTIFGLYALTIAISLAVEVVTHTDLDIRIFVIIYLANFLNLSIAAILPPCLLLMSGEMRRLLCARPVVGLNASLFVHFSVLFTGLCAVSNQATPIVPSIQSSSLVFTI